MTGLRGLWRSARLDNGASHPKRAAEAYPRAGGKRVVRDVWAFYGTEALFKKAGFRKVRGTCRCRRVGPPGSTMRATSAMPRT